MCSAINDRLQCTRLHPRRGCSNDPALLLRKDEGPRIGTKEPQSQGQGEGQGNQHDVTRLTLLKAGGREAGGGGAAAAGQTVGLRRRAGREDATAEPPRSQRPSRNSSGAAQRGTVAHHADISTWTGCLMAQRAGSRTVGTLAA